MATWSREVFARNLRTYMELNGKTQKELAEIVGVSAPTMNAWLQAKKYPRIDKIEILANYFGILKSDLIEEKEKPTGETTDEPFANLSEEARKFLVVFEKLTPDQKEQLYRLALTIVGEAPQPL